MCTIIRRKSRRWERHLFSAGAVGGTEKNKTLAPRLMRKLEEDKLKPETSGKLLLTAEIALNH